MERLSKAEEGLVKEFVKLLEAAEGPDDLFPPDGGVGAGLIRPCPSLPPMEQIMATNIIDDPLSVVLSLGRSALNVSEASTEPHKLIAA